MISQFRQDLVSGEWVLIAANRAHKPHAVLSREDNFQAVDDCPFEDPQKSGHGDPLLVWPEKSGSDWRFQIVQNKFPALMPGADSPITTHDEYRVIAGVGHHELVIMRDHDKGVSDFSVEELSELFKVYRARYVTLAQDPSTQYIIAFHNYGKEGGASVYHPHSQIISMPILSPDVTRSIEGAVEYYRNNKKEVYGVMIDHEVSEKKRILYENDAYIAFCPFVSKIPYEFRIYPKIQNHKFENVHDDEMLKVADILHATLQQLKKALNDPSFNYFIHTAPIMETGSVPSSEFYRWHIEVKPRIKFDAGFEAGTGVKINIIDPDDAAALLRGGA